MQSLPEPLPTTDLGRSQGRGVQGGGGIQGGVLRGREG